MLFNIMTKANVRTSNGLPTKKVKTNTRPAFDLTQLSNGSFKISLEKFKEAKIEEHDGISFVEIEGKTIIVVLTEGAVSLDGKKGSKKSTIFSSNVFQTLMEKTGVYQSQVREEEVKDKEGNVVLKEDGTAETKKVYRKANFKLNDVTDFVHETARNTPGATPEEIESTISKIVKAYEPVLTHYFTEDGVPVSVEAGDATVSQVEADAPTISQHVEDAAIADQPVSGIDMDATNEASSETSSSETIANDDESLFD